MRDAWLPLGLVVVVVGVVPLACGQAFQLSGSAGTTTSTTGAGGSPTTTGGGGDGSGGGAASSGGGSATSTSTSTSTSTGSGGKLCTTTADCPGINTLCGDYICQQGHCAVHQLQVDGVSFSQLYGDCHVEKCLKAKLVLEVSTNDSYDDGNPCTKDACDNGVPSNKVQVGSQCGASGVCNSKGACVECVGNGTCDGNKPTCVNNYCSGDTCQNQVPDGNETDVDCGGSECGPCIPGQICKVASDCLSKVCEDAFVGAIFKQCKVAMCGDGVQNGTETDLDCGGIGCPDAKRCIDGNHCALGSDCKSGVCQAGICQVATCKDGVKNGMETGVDCGVAGCVLTKCPGG
jgi:hypothetical protein